MIRRELRQSMKAQRLALRASMRSFRERGKARLDADPAVRRERRRRRVRQVVTLALLILIASLVNCQCEAPPPPEAPSAEVKPQPAPTPKPPAPAAKPKAKPLTAKLDTQPRGALRSEARPSPTWLDDFRLQVAARSPRLSRCFKGAERPGALRWTTAVNPQSGAVSDHALEPQGSTQAITTEQRDCLLDALSAPKYRLRPAATEALPDRVGIVIEF